MKTPRSAFYGPSKDQTKPKVLYLNDDAESFIGKVNDGGLTLIGDELTPYSGYDPTADVNVYDFDPQVKKWYIPQTSFKQGREKIRAPVHAMMVRPLSAKGRHIATVNCSTWPHPEKWFGAEVTTKNFDTALGSYLHRLQRSFQRTRISRSSSRIYTYNPSQESLHHHSYKRTRMYSLYQVVSQCVLQLLGHC